jgi:hypothetical protein
VTTGTTAAFEATCVAESGPLAVEAGCAVLFSDIDDAEAASGGSSASAPVKYEHPDSGGIVKAIRKNAAASAC